MGGVGKLVERVGSVGKRRRVVEPDADSEDMWWKYAAVEVPSHDDMRVENLAAPRLSMKSERAEATFQNMVDQQAISSRPDASHDTTADTRLDDHHDSPLVTTTEVLQELAKQYQETLYLSRTSLAYFAKGPLSRARAAFTTSSGETMHIAELIAFLREIMLTASVLDKKYKNGIPEVVTGLVPIGLETPEQTRKPKKKRRWKAKRGRLGFFGEEKEIVEKWWLSLDDSAGSTGSPETTEQLLKSRLPRVRSRETYLQVVVALEILALEAAHPRELELLTNNTDVDEHTQLGETQKEESQVAKPEELKAKKRQDLRALLEVLLERLCIWHSLESHSPASGKIGENKDDSGDHADELKGFCIEVVIPFYLSRIPQHATNVNKKLGGPTAPSPSTRKTTSIRKPGEPASRPAPEQRFRKTLSRVSSAVLTHPSRHAQPPSLHRSATDSKILQQHLKRETSEQPLSLDKIPPIKPLVPRKRTSLMHSISFSRREVDLSAMSQANEKKLKKKTEVEEKLRDAISTLKKPDRVAAGREVVGEAEKRGGRPAVGSRRNTDIPRVTAGRGSYSAELEQVKQQAFVAATPKHTRMVRGTPMHARHIGVLGTAHKNQASVISAATTHVPSSSARIHAIAGVSEAKPRQQCDFEPMSSFAIPQTGHRPRHYEGLPNSIRTIRPPASATNVLETPSRGFAKFMPVGLGREPGTLEAESPSVIRRRGENYGLQQTPLKPMRPLSLAPSSTMTVPGTALVEASANPVRSSSIMGGSEGKMSDRGISAALGWDEEDYEPLV
ncbi:hypothetical protein LTR62_002049 [Meristemomyces frigidus]|uniref:DNA replication regulator Sld3 C-terminal domain-containing protein n=1 Tax=Meristemomyces frigidus TaxID=1508187 RepID=A0AAN7TMP7_9PEZI|nr:hypothetical protein LTR62_002049 [Meristemomyces frigidus]